MTTATFELKLATKNDTHRLEIWEAADKRLRVVVWELPLHAGYRERVLARKEFPDCETQHDDSERWLNDQVGWPNDFAGLLSARIWEHL
jgi:hypothetical protein